ncbi:polysaccharide deacetylase family protein [Paenibacillus sp. GSMTC-2017]|uniref:polysaccharide deacetylase family protein n=1 Tax=Paenibacillus sp. GSMTC-2017 TaxID=2794350 RepID=UPI0018D9C690|nr:polysaccharide deacetylase family protein [Paenibacillus sp. GSMTC-2017]MBH5319180.1 polysaccharide deacetylase family protein [Paenibacillus sp. GSMTC-2017]
MPKKTTKRLIRLFSFLVISAILSTTLPAPSLSINGSIETFAPEQSNNNNSKKTVKRQPSSQKNQNKNNPNKNRPPKRAVKVSWVKLQKQYPGAFMMSGSREQKKVALTFDDVPDPRYTPAVLDILAEHHIRATFFVVGERAAKHPALVRRIKNEGHIIGNHSYNHAIFSKLTTAQFQKQILQTNRIIKNISGLSPRLIRPPYGDLLPQQVIWGKQNGYTIVNWDVDSEDWKKNPSSSQVIANINRTLQPGSIILQHAGGGVGQSLSGTIDALPILIEELQSKGYDLVTLPELIGKRAYR